MPILDHATFIDRLKGKPVDVAQLRSAYRDLNVEGIAGHGVIEGTSQNLEKLWEIIDNYDHDGNVNTISDPPALSIAEWLFAKAGSPASGGEAVSWRKVAEFGDRSITDNSNAHKSAIDSTGVGLYYGDHSRFHDDILRGNLPALQTQLDAMSAGNWRMEALEPGSVAIKSRSGQAARLRESSCIGWVMENVKVAYEGAGNGERFAEINRKVKDADLRGTVLCEELQKDGWTAVFYSPRTAEDLADSGEREKLGALNMAKAGSRVWKSPIPESNGVRCDALVSGYRGVTPDSNTEAMLEKLENAPFFVGVANGGIHTFVGHNGSVCDFHWTAQPDDKNAMTENPIREWKWDTGLYMVPPGYW
ncbi:MAG: hypothetical protein M3Q16_10045 [Pseudomonadota bacterium]|nr:hypothetical protein [Pseudomonadota bacterium]